MRLKILLICILVLLLILGFQKVLAPTVEASTTIPIAIVVIKSDLLFEKIALCESQNDPHQKNNNSTASGRFEFLWSSWNHYGKEFWGEEFYSKNIWDYKDNTDLAWYVYIHYGTKDWNASKDCWISAL